MRVAEISVRPMLSTGRNNPHMSHQTGAGSLTLSFQMIELMKKFRQARAVQTILRQIPIFQADIELEHIYICKSHMKLFTLYVPWKRYTASYDTDEGKQGEYLVGSRHR
jgi:hypothetical protein